MTVPSTSAACRPTRLCPLAQQEFLRAPGTKRWCESCSTTRAARAGSPSSAACSRGTNLLIYATGSGALAVYSEHDRVLRGYDSAQNLVEVPDDVIEHLTTDWGDYFDDPVVELDL